MLHEGRAPVGGGTLASAAQTAHAHAVQLLADVVQLAVELGERPAQAPGGRGGRGDLGGAGPHALEHRLGQGQDQEQLRLGHGRHTDRGLARVLTGAGDVGEVVPSGEQVDLVGGGSGGEGEDHPGEDERHAGARGEAGLDQPVAVGEGGGQPRALVGHPPQAVLAGEHEEAAVKVGVVVDVEVAATADDEGAPGLDAVDLAGEVQDELVGSGGQDGAVCAPGGGFGHGASHFLGSGFGWWTGTASETATGTVRRRVVLTPVGRGARSRPPPGRAGRP